jgi:hypothetical protein
MYLGNMVSEFKTDITVEIHRYNKVNGTAKGNFSATMVPSTKSRLYNITSKAALKYDSEV